MPSHGNEVPLPLRYCVVTCRLLYHSSYAEIERKTGVQERTAAKIVQRVQERAFIDDFLDILGCVDNLETRGALPRIICRC